MFSGKRTDNLSLLKQQQHLLHEGLEATAVVMDTTMYDDKVGNLFPVRLWLKLKKSDRSEERRVGKECRL